MTEAGGPPIVNVIDDPAPALRAFFGIARCWDLSEIQQMQLLGLSSRATLRRWAAQRVTKVGRDVLERISYVLGIFKAINTILPVPERADAWLHKANKAPLFGGGSALDRMTSGNVSDLYVVRRYLDHQLN